ncbi:MAG: VCBS repeat-containing protein, partial [Gaiellaceae bacterium]
FTGTFGVSVNTTVSAAASQFRVGSETITLNLPPGPYLRVEGTGVRLELAGQRVTGDFVFEQAQVGAENVVRILARNVTGAFGDGTTSFVTLTEGTGFLVLMSQGLAGELGGNVSITIPGVSVSGRFSLAINNRAAGINETIAFGPQPGATSALALGDVNGDGRPDLVVGVAGAKNVLYLNDGNGSPFDTLPGLLIGAETDNTTGLALGDVDRDGDLDLIVANDGNPNRLYLNDGTGVFTLDAADLGTGASKAIVVGDLNGDGFPDVVVGVDGGANTVYLNEGDDETTEEWLGFDAGAAVATGDTTSTRALALADLDGDGLLDLVAANHGQTNRVYRNLGVSTDWDGFDAAVDLGTHTENTVALATGDVDGDGFLDVVAVNRLQPARVHLNLTTGSTPAFSAGTEVPGSSALAATSVALMDVDVDGDLDVVVGVDGAASTVFLNGGSARRSGADGVTEAGTDTFTAASGAFAAGDVGKLITIGSDRYLIGAHVSATEVTLDRNAAAAGTALAWSIRTWNGLTASSTHFVGDTTNTKALAVGDLNGDARADLVVGNSGQSNRLYDGASALASSAAIGAVTINLPGGPYLRVSGDNVVLSVLGQTLQGSFQFTQQTLADGSRVVDVVVPAATLRLGDGLATLNLSGALRIVPGGLAGKLSLGASLTLGPVTLAGTLHLLVNTATSPVTLGDGTRLPAGSYLRIEGAPVTVALGDASLVGSFVVEQTTNTLGQRRLVLAASGVTVSFGATSVLSGAEGVLVVQTAGVAGQLSGTVDLSSFLPAGVTFLGTFGLAVNRTSQAVGETVTVGGRTIVVDLPAGPFVRLSGTGVQLVVLGQTLSGNFAVEQTPTETRIVASNVTLRLGTATTDLLTITNGQGAFRISSAPSGIAGILSGNVTLNVPGLAFTGTLRLELNTAASPVDHDGDSGTPMIPAQTLRVGVTGATLTVAGQRLSGNFSFSQTRNAANERIVRLAADSVSLFLGDDRGTAATGDDLGLFVTGGTASFLVTPQGIAGELSALVTAQFPGLDVISISPVAVLVQVDNTIASPFVRVQLGTTATPVSISVFDQSLSGVFSFEQVRSAGPDRVLNTSDDTRILRIAASGVTLTLGTANAGVSLTNGSALLVITPEGVAGDIAATATLNLSSTISASAQVRVTLNTLQRTVGANVVPVAVEERFLVGGVTQTLSLPAGRYVRVAITGLSFAIGGQTLTGDFTVERVTLLGADNAFGGTGANADETRTRISIANLRLRIGTDSRDFVVVSNGQGVLELAAAGVFGRISANVAVSIPGVSVGGTFEVLLNTTGAPQMLGGLTLAAGVTVSGRGVHVDVLGQRLSGNFTFVKDELANEIRLTLENVTLALGNGTTTFVTVTISSGAIVLLTNGVAASVTASISLSPALAADFVLNTGTVTFELNTAPVVALGLPAGPFLRVRVAGASVQVLGQSLSGSFTFEQLTTAAGTKVVRIAFTGVELFVGDQGSNIGVRLQSGTGALLITPQGIAGRLSGTPTFTLGGSFSVGAALVTVEFNRLTTAVNEIVDGTPLQLAAGPYVRVAARNASVVIGGESLVSLDLFFERATRGGAPITKVGVANLSFAGIDGARGALIVLPTGVAGVV